MHANLEFTMEIAIDNKLALLDVMVRRKNQNFHTNIYRKRTFSGDYVPYNFYSPMRQKLNLISCLAYRAMKICSKGYLKTELVNVERIFTTLAYPLDIIKYTIQKTKSRFKSIKLGPKKCPVYLKLPYNQNIVVHNNLKRLVENGYWSVNLRILYTTKKLYQINNKDKLPTLNTSSVIYKFVCLCKKKTYVGRTSNNLITRINQHLPKTLLNKIMLCYKKKKI